MPDELPPELRLFVAIPVPNQVKVEVEGLQNEIRRDLPSGAIRWTRPEQFHLTLKFLGNVAAHRVEGLTGALATACSRFAPLQLRARTLGFFPNSRAPRVFWVGIDDGPAQLNHLQAAIESAAKPFTTEPAEKHFHAHLTLARLKNPPRHDLELLGRLVKPNLEKDFGHWSCPAVDLMRSSLSPSGAIHSVLATTPLSLRL